MTKERIHDLSSGKFSVYVETGHLDYALTHKINRLIDQRDRAMDLLDKILYDDVFDEDREEMTSERLAGYLLSYTELTESPNRIVNAAISTLTFEIKKVLEDINELKMLKRSITDDETTQGYALNHDQCVRYGVSAFRPEKPM